MDPEISFGDLQHVERQRQRRPDENKHFAVTPVFEPGEGELRIYVDIDAMRDMELHALSNTNVELGGVLLGGQYEDEDGRPFVVVTDALRAQHYESTKGSFKFTHDTWSQITRERDEFPDDIQMVGWYHTHPDWGVFLSGMDMFICDNFFNKTLDVALVIDPCRDDRGFFQWTGNPSQRKRRTGGFHLFGSRFRAAELEEFAADLEGQEVMARESRLGGYGAPVVNIADRNGAWQAPAIMGMLTVQFCVLALLVWKVTAPPGEAADARDKQLVAIEKRLEEIAAIRSEQALLDAKREVLDEVIGQVQEAPQGLATALEEERIRSEQLAAAVSGQLAVSREKDANLRRQESLYKQELGDLDRELKEVKATNDKLAGEKKELSSQLANYKERLKEYEPESKEEDSDKKDEPAPWTKIAIWGTVAAVVALVLGGLIFFTRRSDEEEMFSEEPTSEPNNPEGPPAE